jgi:hypothetical protein
VFVLSGCHLAGPNLALPTFDTTIISACCTAVPHDSPPHSDIQKKYFWPYSCCWFVHIDGHRCWHVLIIIHLSCIATHAHAHTHTHTLLFCNN